MAYSRQQLPAARAYVDSVFAAGGARTGRGTRHPSTWSDAYTLRVANVWQRQSADGRPLSLQEARRGPGFVRRVRAEQEQALSRGRTLRGGLEHPRQRFVGPTEGPRNQPDLEGSVGFFARQYRTPRYALRFLSNLTTDRLQVIGYGPLIEGYGGTQPGEQWRVLFTGPRDVARETWPSIEDGYHVGADGSERFPIFERVRVYELRWGPGIGD